MQSHLEPESQCPSESMRVAGAIRLENEVGESEVEVDTSEYLVEREGFRLQCAPAEGRYSIRSARRPHLADAGVGREHEKALGNRQVDALGLKTELVHAGQLGIAAAYADRRRHGVAVHERVT